jgi:hypothetical protein
MSKVRDLFAGNIRHLRESGAENCRLIDKLALTPPEYNQLANFQRSHLMTGGPALLDGRELGGAKPGLLAIQPNLGAGRQVAAASVPVELAVQYDSVPVDLALQYDEEPPEGFTPIGAPISPEFEGLGDADETRRVAFGVNFDELQ